MYGNILDKKICEPRNLGCGACSSANGETYPPPTEKEMQKIVERWKEIVGFEGFYEVSDKGNVRSLTRKIIKSNGVVQVRNGRMCNITENQDGYRIVKLSKNSNSRYYFVHRLVALMFVDNPGKFTEVNHLNCIRNDNYYENLEWTTHNKNIKHSAKKGHYKRFGERNSNYKNDTLKIFYRDHPEEALRILARKGAQNGRSVKMKMLSLDGTVHYFGYIGECAEFLIETKATSAKVTSLRAKISNAIKTGKPYLGNMFYKQ